MNKKHLYTLLCMMTIALGVAAQNPIQLNLWENGLPNSNGIEAQGYDDAKSNFRPGITVFLPKTDKPARAVVICPGGGYSHLAMSHEGTQWADIFGPMGIATIVLKYRMPHGNEQVPQSDAYEAIRTVKRFAKEWNINPDDIGIMGFSAGGHLASTVATHAPDDARPAFQILWYPVVTMNPTFTHMGSRENLLGKNPTAEMEKLYSNELQVDGKTPRAFLSLADDDRAVNPLNAARYYEALKLHNIPASLFIYPSGGHGYGINESHKYHLEMLLDLKAWLQSF